MSAENVELVSALQPDASVDLVELFRQDEAWENVFGLVAPILDPDVETGFVGRPKSFVMTSTLSPWSVSSAISAR